MTKSRLTISLSPEFLSMTVNGKSYTIIKLLGKGKGGYSYLAESGNNRYVLKQIQHEPCDYYQFGNKLDEEIRDYKKLKEIGIKMPAMLETDVENNQYLYWQHITAHTLYAIARYSQFSSCLLKSTDKSCHRQ